MGYNPNCIDVGLADVIGSTPDHDDHVMDWDFYLDLDFDFHDDEDEDDRPAYFHGTDFDIDVDDEEPVIEDVGYDPNEIILPFTAPVSRERHARHPTCPYGCCYSRNLRPRRHPKFNTKPKRKNHRG